MSAKILDGNNWRSVRFILAYKLQRAVIQRDGEATAEWLTAVVGACGGGHSLPRGPGNRE